jgi:hypothetical protein
MRLGSEAMQANRGSAGATRLIAYESSDAASESDRLINTKLDQTPTAAFAASGSREIIGGGALSNLFTYRWHGITASYGNYISFFNGDVLTNNDPRFPAGVNQQIMKNGLRFDIPFHNDWIIDVYGIYIGVEVGRHFTWNVEGQNVDLGFLSLGLYTELGNNYQSGHVQIGSAWRF